MRIDSNTKVSTAPSTTSTRTTTGRRNFLRRSSALTAATAGALAAGRTNAQSAAATDPALLPPNTPPWTRSQGGAFVNPPYGLPSRHEAGVVRVLPNPVPAFPTASRTPLQNLHGIITPSGLTFERHHAGVPDISPDAHRLMVHGLVERPLLFTMDEIVRFPSVSRIYFLECSGNSAAELLRSSGKTAQEIHGLLSCAEWTGVSLATVQLVKPLCQQLCAAKPGGRQVVQIAWLQGKADQRVLKILAQKVAFKPLKSLCAKGCVVSRHNAAARHAADHTHLIEQRCLPTIE